MSYNQNLKNGDPTIDIILFLTDKTKSPCFKFSIELQRIVLMQVTWALIQYKDVILPV